MDDLESYKWGEIFASPWDVLVLRMAERSETMGMEQEIQNDTIVWHRDSSEECRWVFISDPSDTERIRAVYNDDENTRSPACYIVVKQPDPSDSRGEIIFDIFRMNSQSLLWHFNRVYTRPKNQSG